MQKQKLPRLVNTTPELDAADIAFERGAKPLGRGGFGVVLRATLISSQERVAVKKLFSVANGAPLTRMLPLRHCSARLACSSTR